MKKYIVILTAVFFLLSASIASAHTGLETSKPAEGSVVKDKITQLNLTFETKIENLSTMKVTRDGKPVDVKVKVNNNEMTGTASAPLENGKYDVNYKIVGADGHVIQKSYSFTVQQPKEEAVKKAEPKKEEKKEVKPKKEEKAEPKEKNSDSSSKSTATLFIVIMIVAVIVAVVVIRKRK